MITVETLQSLNHILGISTIIGIFASLLLVYDLYSMRYLEPLILRFGVVVAFCVALCVTALTLVYSELFGVIPCGFCWLERVMLYPQVILLAGALYIKDRYIPMYGILLSVCGLIISLYHHYIQMGGSQFVKCPATGAGADCAKRIIFEFGFVTFPLMAGVLFAFLIILYMYILRVRPYSFRLAD
jgi:disulfide bond formation protein DsbB